MLDISSHPTSIAHCGADDLANLLSLHQQMEKKLALRYQKEPENLDNLQKLADCKRKAGKLNEAITLYEKQQKNSPNDSFISYRLNALKGTLNPLIAKPLGVQPAPLIKHTSFLSIKEYQQALGYMQKKQANYTPAKVGLGENAGYTPDIRNNTDLKGKHPIKFIFRDKIQALLSNITESLGLATFNPGFIEVKLRRYQNGEYFRTHQDGGSSNRLLTFVYFLFQEPKAFEGGDLILFDTDPENDRYSNQFTRIAPQNNTLFVFPSHYYHAVLPVKTNNTNFLSARFAINGHIRENKDKFL